jgi:thioredoxin-related protein
MKYIIVEIVTVFSLACAGQSKPASAKEVLQEATKLAAVENKNVFIMFTASWCGWCRKMDKSMNDSLCKSFFDDNYISRHLIVDEPAEKKQLENPGADSLKKFYNGDGQGIPFWLVFDKKGKLLADSRMKGESGDKLENTGCPASEREVNHFIEVLGKTSSISKEQLEIIRKRFRQNEN